MAGANYEVNIQLKADPALKSLERIEQKINKLTKTSVDLQDARGAAMVKNRNLADRINKLEEKGVAVAKMRERLGRAIEKTDKGSFQAAAAHEKILRREVKKEEQILDLKKKQLSVDKQQSRTKGPGRAQNAILGGGFPLLFGGSPFQAAAGAIGGAAGGFAGGIGLQVLAGQIENVLGRAAQLGQGLNGLTFDLDGVVTAAGFANTETANFLERIEQYGDAAVAARLATELLEKRVGEDGVQALKDFGETAGKLGSALSTIFSQVLAKIAEVAGPLLTSLAKFAGQQADIGAFRARTGLTGQEKLAQDILNAGGIGGDGGAAGMRSGRNVLLERFRSRAQGLGMGDMSAQQLQKFALQTATQSQRAFELPTLEKIELEASLVEDPSQRSARLKKDREAAKKERESIREFLAHQKQQEKDRLALIEAENKITLANLQAKDKIVETQNKREGLLQARLEGTEKEYLLQEKNKEIQELDLKPLEEESLIAKEEGIFRLEEQVKVMEKQKQLFEQIGQTVKAGLVDGIMSALDGTKSLSESLSGVLNQLARMFIQTGVSQLGQAFKIPGFANGGRPPVGRPSIVGERGPELFVPDRAGTIVPNNALGGSNIVVNVDASGSSVEGDAQQSKALGQALGAAVKAELIKQKMPGGLLA